MVAQAADRSGAGAPFVLHDESPPGLACPRCATAAPGGAKFCSECGCRLAAASGGAGRPSPAVAAPGIARAGVATERRQVTAMFCDLVGSTPLSALMDPEDLRDVIGAYQRCITDEVGRLGGAVTKCLGDGVLACFGYPQAHEDDAERAIRAGLAAIEAVSRIQPRQGSALQLRVGVATGLAVVGDILGTGYAHRQDVAGETLHVAARLQGLAAPDALVIAGSTRRLVGDSFALRPLGEMDLRGFADPVEAWQVLGPNPASAGRFGARQVPGAEQRAGRLIGRRDEAALLLDRWRRASAGEGQVVLLSGEAGIGKSRLVAALRERVQEDGGLAAHAALSWSCSTHQQDSPFHPVTAELAETAGLAPEDDGAQRSAKLAALAAPGPEHAGDAALLASLLLPRAPAPDATEPQEPARTLARLREETMGALLRRVEHLSARRPALVVVEDAHWIDQTSSEFLDLLVERAARLRVLVLVTGRPEFKPRWTGRSHVTACTLGALDAADSAALVAEVAHGAALPHTLAADIVERTDGMPLFIEELTRAILEDGEAVLRAGGATLDALSVPTRLQAFLLSRLDRLGPARDVAQVGAAIGREFPYDLLAAVAGKPAAALDAALGRLVEAGVVSPKDAPAHRTYLFKHALIQDAAYDTMLRQTRRELHQRIARTLEENFPETVQAEPAVVARHCIAAGLTEQAVPYCLAAGKQAFGRSAMPEAVSHLRRGLALLAGLPEGGARDQCELDLHAVLGKALIATQGSAAPATGETYARANGLLLRLDAPTHLVPVMHGQWTHALLRADLAAARRYATDMLAIGGQRGDVTLTMMGHRFAGTTCFALGEFAAACDHLRQGVRLYDPARRAEYAALTVDDPRVVTRMYLTWSLLFAGHLDEARRQHEAALAEARGLRQPYTLAHALTAQAYAAVMLDDPGAALPVLGELVPLSRENGIAYHLAVATVFRGWCRAATGDVPGGLDEIKAGVEAYRAAGSLLYVPFFLALLADVLGRAGRIAEGLRCLDEAVGLAGATGGRSHDAEVHRIRGGLLATAGGARDRDTAEAAFRAAVAIARHQGAKLAELRAATQLAELRGSGNEDARAALLAAYEAFRDGFDTAPLRRATVLLDGGR
jgi:predicted ATPase/class 3 adenylate cyclase